jgi:hypothetical protein
VPPPKSRDNRFSFGLSALDPFSSTTSAPKHQNSKQSATAVKKKDTGTPPQDSFFGLGSLLDPFGFFGSSSDEVEQKPQPRTEKATEAAPDTNANNAGGGGRGEEAKTQHRGAQRPKNPAVSSKLPCVGHTDVHLNLPAFISVATDFEDTCFIGCSDRSSSRPQKRQKTRPPRPTKG